MTAMDASRGIRRGKHTKQLPLYAMLIPGVLAIFIFNYIPLAGSVIAFQKFVPARGLFGAQEWVGFKNFQKLFLLPDTASIIYNTVFISVGKLLLNVFIPVVVALLVNEIRQPHFKHTLQVCMYLPYFLSWVAFGGIISSILSPGTGIVNRLITALGAQPVYFLGDANLFAHTVILTDVLKTFGYNTIIYFAALTAIDPTQYEAAIIDGAKRWQTMYHITLPGIRSTIVVLATLSLANVLNAGFEQILLLYSPQVYATGDVIDTFVYRTGLMSAQYSLATAVGLMKSVVSLLLMSASYYLAWRFADYRIF